ncbi:MAG: Na(+)-translocating NADH-quinone reductase subunit A [Bacteroidales bacterium]|nr:Na(+)-translocating NADH-quinone reductase subunit A [Bacteroidales bacterium]
MNVNITKGLDLKLNGAAPDATLDFALTDRFSIRPSDFRWLLPKLLVQAGDRVEIGTPLLCDKRDERIVIVSPMAGTAQEIVRGEKRVIEEVTIARDSESAIEATVDFDAPTDGDSVRKLVLQYGLWPCLRQRPFATIPNPDSKPKSVFIPCFDSNPLAPDFNVLMRGKEEYFRHGIQMLQIAASDVPIHLCMREGADNQLFESVENVQKHYFSGPHPAGNVGTHIHYLDPINKGDIIWYIDPQEVARIGQFFAEHTLQFVKIAALTGSVVKNPGYFSTVYGADLTALLMDNLTQENVRLISGSVLSGSKLGDSPTLRFHDRQITVIAEGGQREILGWLLPGLKKWSLSRTFLSWLTPKRTYDVNTSLHGGRRAIIMTDVYDKVFPFDLMPLQLLKACEIKDIEQMEALGIYEVDSEDFALCELVCPSKKEWQRIVETAIHDLYIDSMV